MTSLTLRRALASATLVLCLTSCGLFGPKTAPATYANQGAQEFDPYTNAWKPATRIVVPGPSQPNAALAQQKADTAKDNNPLTKAGRAVGNTASAVGRAVSKPLEWLPGGKKEEGPAMLTPPTEEELKTALPAIPMTPAKSAGQ